MRKSRTMATQLAANNWRLVIIALACCFAMVSMALDGSNGRHLPAFQNKVRVDEAMGDLQEHEMMAAEALPQPGRHSRMAPVPMAADAMSEGAHVHAKKAMAGQSYQRTGGNDDNQESAVKLIKSFDVGYLLATNHTAQAFERINTLVTSHSKAYVERSHRQSSNAHLTIRAPADSVEVLLASMTTAIESEGLGHLDSESASVDDVTLRYVDQAARVKSLQTARDQLNRLIAEAGSVGDILNVQRELTRVQAQLDSQQAQLNHLDNQVGLSKISVQLWEDHRQPSPPQPPALGVVSQALRDVARAWAGLLHVLIVFGVQAMLFGLPLAGLVTMITLGGIRLYKTLRPSGNELK
eukprot:m.54281 g.54281  ORF g.54281 m.54281 type:complete len:353 (+) comp13613_c0_seq1:129-1187(+)